MFLISIASDTDTLLDMASASLAFVLYSIWYTPTASSATCPTPRMTDLTSKMNNVSCDIATDFIYNINSDMLHAATSNATLAFGYINEFIDDLQALDAHRRYVYIHWRTSAAWELYVSKCFLCV